jgi:hypothetical protein
VPYRGGGPALLDLIGGQGDARHCFQKCAHGMGTFLIPASPERGREAYGKHQQGACRNAQEGLGGAEAPGTLQPILGHGWPSWEPWEPSPRSPCAAGIRERRTHRLGRAIFFLASTGRAR